MKRIISLDLARGFTVLCIPAIHSIMCYSQPCVYTTWLGYPLAFIAEGPGAQLFMTVMGIVFTFKKQYLSHRIILRALLLCMAGYLLNVLKFIVPYSLGVMPIGVQQALQLPSDRSAVIQLLSIGDILPFASIALLVLHAVYKFRHYEWYALGGAITIVFLAPIGWDRHSNSPIINYGLQLLGGQPPSVFFPLLPWLVYPVLGLFIGKHLQQWPQRMFRRCGQAAVPLLILGFVLTRIFHAPSAAGFYRTLPSDTLTHVGIVLLTLAAWQYISLHIRHNVFFELLTFCSRNITVFYIIEWILISWLLPVIGYQTLGTADSMMIAIGTTLFTLSTTYLYERFTDL